MFVRTKPETEINRAQSARTASMHVLRHQFMFVFHLPLLPCSLRDPDHSYLALVHESRSLICSHLLIIPSPEERHGSELDQ